MVVEVPAPTRQSTMVMRRPLRPFCSSWSGFTTDEYERSRGSVSHVRCGLAPSSKSVEVVWHKALGESLILRRGSMSAMLALVGVLLLLGGIVEEFSPSLGVWAVTIQSREGRCGLSARPDHSRGSVE